MLSSLQVITKKIAAIENCEIAGLQNLNERRHSFKVSSFSKIIYPKPFVISGPNFLS